MNLFHEDIQKEFTRIKKLIESGSQLSMEDLKIILLAELTEEDLHEIKQK